MFNRTEKAADRHLVAFAGAIAATTLAVVVSTSPSAAATRDLDRAEWTAKVTHSLSANIRELANVAPDVRRNAAAIVVADFDGTGRLTGTRLVRGTGQALLDREAMRAAGRTTFPRLPVPLRGRIGQVPLEIFFADPAGNAKRAEIDSAAWALARTTTKAEVPAGRSNG